MIFGQKTLIVVLFVCGEDMGGGVVGVVDRGCLLCCCVTQQTTWDDDDTERREGAGGNGCVLIGMEKSG